MNGGIGEEDIYLSFDHFLVELFLLLRIQATKLQKNQHNGAGETHNYKK